MDNTATHVKEALDLVSSECDETEPDGDSVWSSTSAGASQGATDNSSLDLALRDLPTVRASKEEGEDEIQRLILAAEALVVERARLKMSSPASSPGLRCGLAGGAAAAIPSTALVQHREAFADNKWGAANSGYFTDTEDAGHAAHTPSTLSGERSINMDVYGEKDQHSVQSRESLSSTPCDSLNLSKVSDSPLKGHHYLAPQTAMPADTPTGIPRLSLELTKEQDNTRTAGVPEERAPCNKVEKEACNSSIRGSSGGGVTPLKEHQARDSGTSHSPGPPQAG